MAHRGTTIEDRPSTQVGGRPARLSRQVMGALVLVVVALGIALALVVTSGDDVPTRAVPAADTSEVPYTGDWKDSLIEVERAKDAGR